MAQALAPAVVQHAEIRIALVDADDLVGGEAVLLVHDQVQRQAHRKVGLERAVHGQHAQVQPFGGDRKSTRLNSSHSQISYAVFCLKKKKQRITSGSTDIHDES